MSAIWARDMKCESAFSVLLNEDRLSLRHVRVYKGFPLQSHYPVSRELCQYTERQRARRLTNRGRNIHFFIRHLSVGMPQIILIARQNFTAV